MPEYVFDRDQVMEGVEPLNVLNDLDKAYDSYLTLVRDGSGEEVERYKEDIEELVEFLETGPEESPYDNFMDHLETAFESVQRFDDASGEERLEIREEDEEAYNLLVQTCTAKANRDESVLGRFTPNSGNSYHLTRNIIHEGTDSLDRWIEDYRRI